MSSSLPVSHLDTDAPSPMLSYSVYTQLLTFPPSVSSLLFLHLKMFSDQRSYPTRCPDTGPPRRILLRGQHLSRLEGASRWWWRHTRTYGSRDGGGIEMLFAGQCLSWSGTGLCETNSKPGLPVETPAGISPTIMVYATTWLQHIMLSNGCGEEEPLRIQDSSLHPAIWHQLLTTYRPSWDPFDACHASLPAYPPSEQARSGSAYLAHKHDNHQAPRSSLSSYTRSRFYSHEIPRPVRKSAHRRPHRVRKHSL